MADTPAQRPGTSIDTEPETLLYEERRSAQRWPLVVPGLLGPVLMVVGPVLVFVAQVGALIGVSVVGLVLWLATNSNEYAMHRRTGIRITTKRITVGAVARLDDRDPAQSPSLGSPRHLSACAFSCDWDGVQSVTIVTDPHAIAAMRMDPQNLRTRLDRFMGQRREVVPHKMGLLVPPYAKALLVIHVDKSVAHFPEQPARKFGAVYLTWPIWVVPTRHPEELRRALASFPPAASVNQP